MNVLLMAALDLRERLGYRVEMVQFKAIEPELYRFPAIDPVTFRRAVEELFS